MDLLDQKSMKKVVRVGGVPEHFNLAWHLANENGLFSQEGIEINWQDVPGGTGAMCKALRENELDIAITLTEGIVADIMAGNPSKIIQFYVNSPLRWGIYTGVNSGIKSLDEIASKKYAISRYRSGSHLMAFVNARNLGQTIDEEKDFVLVGNMEGARKALANNDAQVFMWEKYMTKPLVDAGEFRFLGECKTPWPCFAVVATDSFIEENSQLLGKVIEVMNKSCYELKFKELEATQMVAWRYQLKLADAKQWFSELEYAYSEEIDEIQMVSILNDLKSLHIIDRLPQIEEVCYAPNLHVNSSNEY
ncbi:MAG: ABC transporter substrate-binding protein [Bacteroidetes bacterium B1(2017)]|nr:MAG: ABC transporter substrate-binding protein [Bacteroidetes bacterium B1(2017)]